MKNQIISAIRKSAWGIMLGAGLCASMTSCKSDDPVPEITEDSEYGSVRFRFSIPVSVNKTDDNSPEGAPTMFGHGIDASSFNYAVYRKNGEGDGASYTLVDPEEYLYEGEAPSLERDDRNPLNFQMVMTMKKGVYSIVFWMDSDLEQNGKKLYTFDAENHRVVVDYDVMNAVETNSEKQDAFFGKVDDVVFSTYTSEAVNLRRPFAQINIGQDGLEYRLMEGDRKVDFEISGVYKTLDLLTGQASGKVENPVKFSGWTSCPKNTQVFKVDDEEAENFSTLQYLSMYYVLTGNSADSEWTGADAHHHSAAETVNAKVTVENAGSVELNNLEISRNYRTNIYGQFASNNVVAKRSAKYFDQEILSRHFDIEVFISNNLPGELAANLVKNGMTTNAEGKYPVTNLYVSGEFNDDDWKCFASMPYLTKLDLAGLKNTTIPALTLTQCKLIETLRLPSGLKELVYLFDNTDPGAVSFEAPYTASTLCKKTIDPVNKIKNITLPSSLEKIGNRSFSGWGYLETLDIPENVTTIDLYNLFFCCYELTDINYPEAWRKEQKASGGGTYAHCRKLTKLQPFPNVETIQGNCFDGSAIDVVYAFEETFPKANTINVDAFANVTTPVDVFKFPERIENIAEGAFMNLNVKTLIINGQGGTFGGDKILGNQNLHGGWGCKYPAFHGCGKYITALIFINTIANWPKDNTKSIVAGAQAALTGGDWYKFRKDCIFYVDDDKVQSWKDCAWGRRGVFTSDDYIRPYSEYLKTISN